MLGLDQPAFWGLVLVLTVLVRGFGLTGSVRAVLYIGATAYVLSGSLPLAWTMLAICTYGFVALRLLPNRVGAIGHTLVMSAIFVASQYPSVLPIPKNFSDVLPLVGLPYIYLRFLHLLADVRNGIQKPPSLIEYATFILPFHQIIAGPVERFGDFQSNFNAPPEPLTTHGYLLALSRIVNGFIKKGVLAEGLKNATGFEFEAEGWQTLLEIDLHALYIYLDFSGYMDIIIGAGILVGWKPPENFNWPYSSRNLIEFWTRWHITLGDFIRDYLFNPINLYLQRGPLRGKVLTAGVISYLVAMIWCGMWHRFNLPFALWGLLHGVGIAVCKYWEWGMKKALGSKKMKLYRKNRVAGAVATVITFHFVSVSFLFAFYSPTRVLQILGSLF